MENTSIKALVEVLKVFVSKNFSLSAYEEDGKYCGIEMETWTTGGVNMIHFLDFRKAGYLGNPLCIYAIQKEVLEIIDSFDTDDEIDSHRQDKRYKSAFSYKEAVEDFDKYAERLAELAYEIDNVVEKYESELTEFDFEDLGITLPEALTQASEE